MKTSGFRGSLEMSVTLPPSQDIQRPSDATDASNGSGNVAANISSEQGSSLHSKSDSDVHVEWAPWRLTHSQFRYRGTPNVFDLGEI